MAHLVNDVRELIKHLGMAQIEWENNLCYINVTRWVYCMVLCVCVGGGLCLLARFQKSIQPWAGFPLTQKRND